MCRLLRIEDLSIVIIWLAQDLLDSPCLPTGRDVGITSDAVIRLKNDEYTILIHRRHLESEEAMLSTRSGFKICQYA